MASLREEQRKFKKKREFFLKYLPIYLTAITGIAGLAFAIIQRFENNKFNHEINNLKSKIMELSKKGESQ